MFHFTILLEFKCVCTVTRERYQYIVPVWDLQHTVIHFRKNADGTRDQQTQVSRRGIPERTAGVEGEP